MNKARQVYVAVLDEGLDVWRSVEAEHIGEDKYVLSSSIPGDEVWEFQPGDVVHCRERTFSDDTTGLVAFARVRRDD